MMKLYSYQKFPQGTVSFPSRSSAERSALNASFQPSSYFVSNILNYLHSDSRWPAVAVCTCEKSLAPVKRDISMIDSLGIKPAYANAPIKPPAIERVSIPQLFCFLLTSQFQISEGKPLAQQFSRHSMMHTQSTPLDLILLHIDKKRGIYNISSVSPIKPFSPFPVAYRRQATSTPLEILVE